MARYKEYDYSQGKFIPIHFDKQIIPGTFEHTLHYLIDNKIDLSIFDLRYQNDEMGAPAYDPAILLKIVLYACSKGITSSREIARGCEENVVFMEPAGQKPETFTEKMKRKIDSIKGRLIYNRRLGTAEPLFAHIRSILGLDRFSFRGKRKVNTQWLLYCITHNLLKVHRYGEEFA